MRLLRNKVYMVVLSIIVDTGWKVSKYGIFSGPYFPVLGLNTEREQYFHKQRGQPAKYQYLDNVPLNTL